MERRRARVEVIRKEKPEKRIGNTVKVFDAACQHIRLRDARNGVTNPG